MSAIAPSATSSASSASAPAMETLLSTASSGAAQSGWAPTSKVSAGILAASVTSLVLPFWAPMTGHELSAAQAAAFTTVITFVIQYFVPDRK